MNIDLSKGTRIYPYSGNFIDLSGGTGVFKPGVRYLLRDEFTTDLAAPLPATFPMSPGPGTWTPRDLDEVISIADGWVEFAAQTDGSPGYARQDLVCQDVPITRQLGQVVMCKWRCATDESHYPLALVNSQTPVWEAYEDVIHGFYRSAALTLGSVDNEAAGVNLMPFVADGTEYWLMMVLQDEGCYYFAQGGAFTELTFLRFSEVGTDTPLYVATAGYEAVFSTTNYKVPMSLFTADLVAGS